ncbi:hypothetical protein PNU83_13300 [Turicibacter sanguinis]|uniref:hypothetical protein n=1 Tax=Turicibacter sanguinis TaxID=154288 RepID=UPI0018A9A501|nr:hypothetical protein [Turicibacter sanguinis]MDB8565100.1 hypothetical protein [Turicibacter sanguinis]
MKKFLGSCLLLSCILTLMGCQTHTTELVPQTLSEKEEYLLSLTGHKVLLYSLNHLPAHDGYELSLTYEVYEQKELVKEYQFFGMSEPEPAGRSVDETIGLNFQGNQIRVLSGKDGMMASGSLKIEEDLTQYSQAFFSEPMALPLGTELYIYYANNGGSIATNIPIGIPLDEVNLDEFFNVGESVILIKLSLQPYSD